MFVLKLTLLSPTKKARLKSLVRFLFSKEIMEAIIVTSALLAIIYMAGWLVLSQTVNDLTQSTLLVNGERLGHNQEIKNINLMTKNIAASAKEYAPITPYLLDIITTVPDDIKINGLSFDRVNKSILISGTAKTRDGLLHYVQAIKAIRWATFSPLSTAELLQKENGNFELHGRITN